MLRILLVQDTSQKSDSDDISNQANEEHNVTVTTPLNLTANTECEEDRPDVIKCYTEVSLFIVYDHFTSTCSTRVQ